MALPIMAVGMAAKAAGQVVGGLTNIASGIIGGGARRREQREAQKEYDIARAAARNVDTSNLAANMQNTMEDLTVNTQAADFAAQQQQQGLANTMSAMQGAAGGSGIAALAQAMAGQQSQNLQKASADIGQQEQRNQMAAASQAANIQRQQIAGANQARNLQGQLTQQNLDIGMARKQAADEARQEATSNIMSGAGQFAGGAAAGAAAIAGGANLSQDTSTMTKEERENASGFLGGQSGFGKMMGGLMG